MDFDNTMLPYTSDEPNEVLLRWMDALKESGIRLCIVSNTHKERVPRFSQVYDIPAVTHAGKPGRRGIEKAISQFSACKVNTAMVGDQIFTDVLGANLAGFTAIAVKSINNHNLWLKLRHFIELPFLAMANKRRVKL